MSWPNAAVSRRREAGAVHRVKPVGGPGAMRLSSIRYANDRCDRIALPRQRGPPVRATMISRSTHFTMPIFARTGGNSSVPPACRTIRSSRRKFLKRTARRLLQNVQREKPMKKLTLSKETLRTLDEQELSLVVGGASGGNKPKCPNTKESSCDCNTNGAVCHP